MKEIIMPEKLVCVRNIDHQNNQKVIRITADKARRLVAGGSWVYSPKHVYKNHLKTLAEDQKRAQRQKKRVKPRMKSIHELFYGGG